MNSEMAYYKGRMFFLSCCLSPYIRLPAVPSLSDDFRCHPVRCALHGTKNVTPAHTEILKGKKKPSKPVTSLIPRIQISYFFSSFTENVRFDSWNVQSSEKTSCAM